MARDRMIPSDFWNDPDLATISREARFCYVGLWGLADDHQVLHNDARRCKAGVYPYDEDMDVKVVAGLIDELLSADWLRPFQCNGSPYLYITYKKPWSGLRHHRKSDLPPPPPEIIGPLPKSAKSAEKGGRVRNLPKSAKSAEKCGLSSIGGGGVVEGSIVKGSKEKEAAADAAAEKEIAESFGKKDTAAAAAATTAQPVPCDSCGKGQICDRTLFHADERGEWVCNSKTVLPSESPTPLLIALCRGYENTIGTISGAIADELRDFAAHWQGPEKWIDLAYKEAAVHNARNWKYVRTVLEAWDKKGGLPADIGGELLETRGGKELHRQPRQELLKASQVEVLAKKKHCPEVMSLWAKVQEEMKQQISTMNYNSWIAPLRAVGYKIWRGEKGETLVVAGPQEFLLLNAASRFGTMLLAWVQGLAPKVTEILYVIDDTKEHT